MSDSGRPSKSVLGFAFIFFLLACVYSHPAETSVILVWDATSKEYHAKTNELSSTVTFYVTNVSAAEVIIRHLIPSCGCTAAQMPAQPWTLPPGASGPISVTTDLRGKRGTLNKTLEVASTAGMDTLEVKILLPDRPDDAVAERSDRQSAAMADPQAVFKGDCAACHATPALGKTGQELYQIACVICHQPTHRASMVPDLETVSPSKSRAYWRTWIAYGRPRSLMPAFAPSQDGPLTEAQIESLAAFASQYFRPQAVETPRKLPMR
jgi:mono/diheme cytochrome c family protein